MRAMAGLGDGPVRRGDIAAAVGATSDELSVPRARLIDKGLVEVAGRGELDFTIPGFAEYVRSRTDSDF
jgi:predicted transcriptional regulator